MPRDKRRTATPPRDKFSTKQLLKESGPFTVCNSPHEPVLSPSGKLRLRWSPSFWSISKPFLSDDGLVAYNQYQETSVCSSTPVVGECGVRVLEDCTCAVGVCNIENGRISTLWKYENDGTRFGYHTRPDGTPDHRFPELPFPAPYGEPYGEGDLITIRVMGNMLSFKKNGQDLGPCFSLPLEDTFYLRTYMCGRHCIPGRAGGGKLEIVATCEICNEEGRLRCPCGIVAYCGKECQKKDWKIHKPVCTSQAKGTSSK